MKYYEVELIYSEYQEYFLGDKDGRCVGLTNLSPSCADCLEIWKPQPPGTLRACPDLYRDCCTFLMIYMLLDYNLRTSLGTVDCDK
jgi:hypothetical protein